jgi:hypothetical protein
VPQEVHNAAMAARRNRKSSCSELLQQQQQQQQPQQLQETQMTDLTDINESKSPQKSKRKAPVPPGWSEENGRTAEEDEVKPCIEATVTEKPKEVR